MPSYGRSAVWKYFQRVADERGEGHVCIVPVPGTNGKSQPCGERKGKNYSLLVKLPCNMCGYFDLVSNMLPEMES